MTGSAGPPRPVCWPSHWPGPGSTIRLARCWGGWQTTAPKRAPCRRRCCSTDAGRGRSPGLDGRQRAAGHRSPDLIPERGSEEDRGQLTHLPETRGGIGAAGRLVEVVDVEADLLGVVMAHVSDQLRQDRKSTRLNSSRVAM